MEINHIIWIKLANGKVGVNIQERESLDVPPLRRQNWRGPDESVMQIRNTGREEEIVIKKE